MVCGCSWNSTDMKHHLLVTTTCHSLPSLYVHAASKPISGNRSPGRASELWVLKVNLPALVRTCNLTMITLCQKLSKSTFIPLAWLVTAALCDRAKVLPAGKKSVCNKGVMLDSLSVRQYKAINVQVELKSSLLPDFYLEHVSFTYRISPELEITAELINDDMHWFARSTFLLECSKRFLQDSPFTPKCFLSKWAHQGGSASRSRRQTTSLPVSRWPTLLPELQPPNM